MPEASKLALLREDIDRNSRRIKAVLNDAGMRREFFKGIPDDEEKAVKAFVSQNQENALKTKPKVTTAADRVVTVDDDERGRGRRPGVAMAGEGRSPRPCWADPFPQTLPRLCGPWDAGRTEFGLRRVFAAPSRGYKQDNENIELLRLRNFTVGKPLPDAVLLSPNAQDTIAELVGIMVPFVRIPSICTPSLSLSLVRPSPYHTLLSGPYPPPERHVSFGAIRVCG
ncbi:hypothetical protein VTN02DRAFT_374 [Thermoascus thermophilus]